MPDIDAIAKPDIKNLKVSYDCDDGALKGSGNNYGA